MAVIKHNYTRGYCHVMALAMKRLCPCFTVKARIGWDEGDDARAYAVDHVYVVDPSTGKAYDSRGVFPDETVLLRVLWRETGGLWLFPEQQIVEFSAEEIKRCVKRGELKKYTDADIRQAMRIAKHLFGSLRGHDNM